MLNAASQTVEPLSIKMDHANTLPEYPVVIALKGVGASLAPQLIAEIGDATRFPHTGVLTVFSVVDRSKSDSNQHFQKSVRTTKKPSKFMKNTFSDHSFFAFITGRYENAFLPKKIQRELIPLPCFASDQHTAMVLL